VFIYGHEFGLRLRCTIYVYLQEKTGMDWTYMGSDDSVCVRSR